MTEQEERNLGYFLTPQGLNPITAGVVRESMARYDEAAFRGGFGMPKASARRILLAWELCRLPKWDGECLQAIIHEKLFPNRDVLAAHIRQELPASFSPLDGIKWAESNRYLSLFGVERKWAEWYAPVKNHAPAQSGLNAESAQQGVTKAVIVGAFQPPRGRSQEQWEKALSDAKRIGWLKPARVDSGRRGVSAQWNPARLAMCICDEYSATPQQRRGYGRIIERHFLDWLPEWKEYASSFE